MLDVGVGVEGNVDFARNRTAGEGDGYMLDIERHRRDFDLQNVSSSRSLIGLTF